MKPTIKDLQQELNMADKTVAELMKEVEQRKNDFSYLEEKYLSLSEAHTNLNAENHSLRKEIERTNRHINLAEKIIADYEQKTGKLKNHYCQPEIQRGEYRADTDTLTVEQQPIIYNNCTFYK